jgi:GTP1/Obg family GTP-binding protein
VCENSVNIPQLKISIAQVDDAVALAQQWLEQLHHLADNGKKAETSADLAQANVLLGEARGRIESAINALEGRAADSGITVELV